MTPSGGKSRSDGPGWRHAATLLGVMGLLVTLAFNTLAVRQSARQDRQASETAQIGLLTQLNSNATDSESAINNTAAVDGACEDGSSLTSEERGTLRVALDYYEYLAWLFNRKRVTVAGSRPFFSERMISGWRLGRHHLGLVQLREKYRELTAFVYDTHTRDRPPIPGCA